MCPGTWILAGGGDGGGGSGKGAGSGKGKQGAGTGDGDEEAGTGDKSADGCGPGGPAAAGGCPGDHGDGGGAATAGDPVDVVSGSVFTFPEVDLELPGPLPLRFDRSYRSSARTSDVGLGWGWTHSFAWRVRIRRRAIEVWRGDGTRVKSPLVEGQALASGPEGLLLIRDGADVIVETLDGVRRRFAPATPDSPWLLLSTLQDPHGNSLQLQYRSGNLVLIIDSVGRCVHLQRDAHGHLVELSVSNPRRNVPPVAMRRYRYDDRGCLVEVAGPDGEVTRFEYDSKRRMTRHDEPSGVCFHYRYDREGRCVETWGDALDPTLLGLDDSVSDKLADGTPAKGIHHVRLTFGPERNTEVATSLELQSYFGNEFGKVDKAVAANSVHTRLYDEFGHVLARSDGEGATWKYERDLRGRVMRATDPLGRTRTYEREDGGHLRRLVDEAGGVTEVIRSDRSWTWINPAGGVWHFDFDDRGLCERAVAPNGGTFRNEYDEEGNLIAQVDAIGTRYEYQHDAFGRPTAMRTPQGEAHYRYSHGGRLLAIQDVEGTQRRQYDAVGNVVEETDGTGTCTRFRYGGRGKLLDIEYPTGERMSLRYDREGRLLTLTNQAGEVHRFHRDLSGQVVEEETFDGRHLQYTLDLNGRVVRTTNGAGEHTELHYNAAGEVIEKVFDDGSALQLEHDPLGNLVRATHSDGAQFEYERNAVGWIICERHTLDAHTSEVGLEYDAAGNLLSRRVVVDGKVRHWASWRRDAQGRAQEVSLDDRDPVHFSYDPMGRLLELRLPRAGRIARAYDALGQLVRNTAFGPTTDDQGPVWVGSAPRDATVHLGYDYDERGDLSRVQFMPNRFHEYQHDPLHRLRGQLTPEASQVLIGRDAAGNPRPDSSLRRYGTGGRLLQEGECRLEYDDAGRLVERHDGQDTTYYQWNGSGLLGAVLLPDGREVRFDYDPLGRRIRKSVSEEVSGKMQLVEETRYVHDGAELVHELTWRMDGESQVLAAERSYCYTDDLRVPLAQCQRQPDGAAEWLYFLTDPRDAPAALVTEGGALVARIERDAYGRCSGPLTTPLGLKGQYTDAETGLCCNRFRYYDPAQGRYISPDPIGLRGGLSPYQYAGDNPLGNIDPDGLMPFSIIRDRSGRKVATGQNSRHGSGVQPGDAAAISSQASASCAETAALHDLVKDLPADQRRAEIQRLFNEEGYTIETYDGSDDDYYNKNEKSKPMNPCPQCGNMFRDLGIQGQVCAPNRKKGKTNSTGTPVSKDRKKDYSRRQENRWDGRSTSH